MIVDDYDEAIRFHVDALGFELVKGAAIGLLLAQANGSTQEAAVDQQFAGRVGLFLRVDDFDTHYARMVSNGVEFVTKPRTSPTALSRSFATSQATGGIC